MTLLFNPAILLAQLSKITIQDKVSHKPLIGISMLSESGSLIGSSDKEGEITFDISSFKMLNIHKVVFYNTDFQSIELSISSIPPVLYLEKVEAHILDNVEIRAKQDSKYFMLRAYVRSWKLINNKLVRYGDGIINYEIPFQRKIKGLYMESKRYIQSFRNFRIDELKAKSRIASISMYDGYFADRLPSGDRISSSWSWYQTDRTKDSLRTVYDEGKNVGYAIFDSNDLPAEINVGNSFEGEEALKIALWWKIAGRTKNIEKWRGKGETRRPTYIFSNKKTVLKSKGIEEPGTEETVTEIFIDEEINYSYSLPEKFKRIVQYRPELLQYRLLDFRNE